MGIARPRLGVLRTATCARRALRCAARMLRMTLLTLLIAAVAAAPAAAHEASLKARRSSRPTPPGRRPSRPRPTPSRRPAPGSAQPVGGFSALIERPHRLPTGRCPTTASAARRTRAPSCCGSTRSTPTADRARRQRRRGDPRRDHPARSRQGDPVPDRQRGHRGPPADRRRLRHRVLPRDRDGTCGSATSSGPFLLHTDATGKVLEAPIPTPGVKSPDYPPTSAARRARRTSTAPAASRAWRSRRDGRTLYPTLEGPLADDDPTDAPRVQVRHPPTAVRRRAHCVYHVRRPELRRSPTSRRWTATASSSLERDNGQGPDAPCTSRRSWSTYARPTPTARWTSARSSTC